MSDYNKLLGFIIIFGSASLWGRVQLTEFCFNELFIIGRSIVEVDFFGQKHGMNRFSSIYCW